MGLALFSGVPWLAVALVRHMSAATFGIERTHLALSRRRSRLDIPLASVKDVRASSLPLPRPGIALVMSSGGLFRYRLESDEPSALLARSAITSRRRGRRWIIDDSRTPTRNRVTRVWRVIDGISRR